MIQKEFAQKATKILESDDNVIGLAAAGSWITDEIDEFSDLDLILVTQEKVSHDKGLMLDYARKLGDFFRGSPANTLENRGSSFVFMTTRFCTLTSNF